MPKQVRHDGDGSVVTLNNILSHQTTACRLYQHPSCSQKSLCHPEQPLAAIDNSTCHPELVSGSVHYCHLEFIWGLPPILGAFYNATTFKMPKQVRHDRSVVTLNNILSHQTIACCHCTLHTFAKLVFSNVAQATYRKKLCFEAPVEFCSKTLTSQSSSCKNVENIVFSTFSHIRMHFRSCKR